MNTTGKAQDEAARAHPPKPEPDGEEHGKSAASSSGFSAHLLKDSDGERTELLSDRFGTRLVRKTIDEASGLGTAYQAISRLHSPYLPQVWSVTSAEGKTVVLMQAVEGPTLRQEVEASGPMDQQECARTALQLLRGIAVLHACTPPVVHRDLTPDNVVCSPAGAMPIDFGIARQVRDDASVDTHAWGTLGYAAPEQFGFGGQSDPRTDVFGCGMLLYFMSTGKDPSRGLQGKLGAGEVPHPLGDVVSKATQIDPDKRFQSVEELSSALVRVAAGVQGPERTAPGKAASSAERPSADPSEAFGTTGAPKPAAESGHAPLRDASDRLRGGRPGARTSCPPPPSPVAEDEGGHAPSATTASGAQEAWRSRHGNRRTSRVSESDGPKAPRPDRFAAFQQSHAGLFAAWRVFLLVMIALLAYGTGIEMGEAWLSEWPALDRALYDVQVLCSVFVCLFGPIAYLGDFFGIVTRNPFYAEHRARRIALTFVVALVVALVVVTVTDALFTPGFAEAMKAARS